MALGLIDLALILTSNHLPLRGAVAVLGLFVGWGWVSTGLFAWSRDPENRVGMLMAATGFAWLISLVGRLEHRAPVHASARCSARSSS